MRSGGNAADCLMGVSTERSRVRKGGVSGRGIVAQLPGRRLSNLAAAGQDNWIWQLMLQVLPSPDLEVPPNHFLEFGILPFIWEREAELLCRKKPLRRSDGGCQIGVPSNQNDNIRRISEE